MKNIMNEVKFHTKIIKIIYRNNFFLIRNFIFGQCPLIHNRNIVIRIQNISYFVLCIFYLVLCTYKPSVQYRFMLKTGI